MVKMTSLPAAASRGVAAHTAPFARRSAAFSRVRVCTRTAHPAASRCPHIERPMTPIPIQPTEPRMMNLPGGP